VWFCRRFLCFGGRFRLPPWRRSNYVSPKRYYLPTILHGNTIQKTSTNIFNASRTSNLEGVSWFYRSPIKAAVTGYKSRLDREEKIHEEFWWVNMLKHGGLEDLKVDASVTFCWIFDKMGYDISSWMGLACLDPVSVWVLYCLCWNSIFYNWGVKCHIVARRIYSFLFEMALGIRKTHTRLYVFLFAFWICFSCRVPSLMSVHEDHSNTEQPFPFLEAACIVPSGITPSEL
jgi:hypothetical protein